MSCDLEELAAIIGLPVRSWMSDCDEGQVRSWRRLASTPMLSILPPPWQVCHVMWASPRPVSHTDRPPARRLRHPARAQLARLLGRSAPSLAPLCTTFTCGDWTKTSR